MDVFTQSDFKSSVAGLIIEKYRTHISNFEYIANERNRILNFRYGTIPSYALWDAESVEMESIGVRLEWFIEMLPIIVEADKENVYYSEISQRLIGPDAFIG
jgi:hypothetical protein